jgi:probable HAF family extracellular repeat protein
MHDLGTLGGTTSVGRAVNAGGQVVGYSYTAGNAIDLAFLYTGTPGSDGTMVNLDAWLDATHPDEGAAWTLRDARGITDAGLITGMGFYNDGVTVGFRAFVLDASALIPEPSSLSLLAVGAPALLRRRRRSRG